MDRLILNLFPTNLLTAPLLNTFYIYSFKPRLIKRMDNPEDLIIVLTNYFRHTHS